MKKIIIIVLMATGFAQAQTNYQKGMSKGMEMIKTAQTYEDFVNASNHFERISNAEKGEWVPVYWNAYTTMIAGMNAKKESKQDEMYDKALALLETINEEQADKSELLTLKAYLKLMKISVSPMTRAAFGTPAAMEMLAEAKKLNPNNPRPLLVHGQNTFYTPEFFGGGKEAAKTILTKALALYENESPSDIFLPRWGKPRTEYLLNQCE